jgi:AcrR family transcriptional regulator
MATQQRAINTRDDILNAAMNLFSLHGFHHTSTNDILEAAAVSKGAFYYHFKSKEELAQKVLDKFQLNMQEEVFTPLLDSGRPESLFDDLITPPDGPAYNHTDRHRRLLARFSMELIHDENGLARRVGQSRLWLTEQLAEIAGTLFNNNPLPSGLTPKALAELIVSIWLSPTCTFNDQSEDPLSRLKLLVVR